MNPPEAKGIYRCSLENVPAIHTIRSGDTVCVELPDSDGLGPELAPLSKELFATEERMNPVFGPIAVEGCEPGDVLKVSFLEVVPNRDVARTWFGPNHGFLSDDKWQETSPTNSPPNKVQRMFLWELSEGRAELKNPVGSRAVVVRTAPFLGCVGTAGGQSLSSMLAGAQGGNIDHPDLVSGSMLWLPVTQEGGLLYLGDMHAAQGHGETAGGALEVSGTAHVQVELCKNLRISAPRYETPQGYGHIAVAEDATAAMQLALGSMIHWVADSGWDGADAAMLVQQSCAFRFGGITKEYAVVSCFLEKENPAGRIALSP